MRNERYTIEVSEGCVEIQGKLTIREAFDFLSFFEREGFDQVCPGQENSALFLMKPGSEKEQEEKVTTLQDLFANESKKSSCCELKGKIVYGKEEIVFRAEEPKFKTPDDFHKYFTFINDDKRTFEDLRKAADDAMRDCVIFSHRNKILEHKLKKSEEKFNELKSNSEIIISNYNDKIDRLKGQVLDLTKKLSLCKLNDSLKVKDILNNL